MTLFQVNVRVRPSSGLSAHYYRMEDYDTVVSNYQAKLATGAIVEYEVKL